MAEYTFTEVPKVGTKHEKFGQTYELVAVRPYTRKHDGGESAVLTWRTKCACGAAFDVEAGMTTNGLTRRCEVHRANRRNLVAAAKAAATVEPVAATRPKREAPPYQDGLHALRTVNGVVHGHYGVDGRSFGFMWSPDKWDTQGGREADRALIAGAAGELATFLDAFS